MSDPLEMETSIQASETCTSVALVRSTPPSTKLPGTITAYSRSQTINIANRSRRSSKVPPTLAYEACPMTVSYKCRDETKVITVPVTDLLRCRSGRKAEDGYSKLVEILPALLTSRHPKLKFTVSSTRYGKLKRVSEKKVRESWNVETRTRSGLAVPVGIEVDGSSGKVLGITMGSDSISAIDK